MYNKLIILHILIIAIQISNSYSQEAPLSRSRDESLEAEPDEVEHIIKVAYTISSLNYFYNQAFVESKKETYYRNNNSQKKILSFIISYPNLITNYLLYKDDYKKLILEKKINSNLSVKEKLSRIFKTIKTKDGIKSIFYANLFILHSALNAGINFSEASKIINGYKKYNFKEFQFNLFYTVPATYLTYLLAKKSIEKFKEGYNKVI